MNEKHPYQSLEQVMMEVVLLVTFVSLGKTAGLVRAAGLIKVAGPVIFAGLDGFVGLGKVAALEIIAGLGKAVGLGKVAAPVNLPYRYMNWSRPPKVNVTAFYRIYYSRGL